jgi:hypothetical protein
MRDKLVSRIVERSLTYHRKSLAWRPAYNHIDSACPKSGLRPNLIARENCGVPANYRRFWKVEFVNGTMNWV